MHQFIAKQPTPNEQSIATPMNLNLSDSENHQSQKQCLFSILPCSSKSKQLRENIENEKLKNQKQFEFSSNKLSLTNGKVIRHQTFIQTHKNIKTKDFHKGICLTGRKDSHNKSCDFETTKCQKNPSNMTNLSEKKTLQQNQSGTKMFKSQTKSYHELNPLSIDRKSYDNEVKLGGNKGFQKTRYSLNPVRFCQSQNNHNESIHVSYGFTNHNTSFFSDIKQKINPIDASGIFYSTADSSKKAELFPLIFNDVKLYESSQKQFISQSFNLQEDLPTRKIIRKSFCKKNPNLTWRKPIDSEFTTNAENQQSLKRKLNFSTFSNHSQKYKQYMTEKLPIPYISAQIGNEDKNTNSMTKITEKNQLKNDNLQHNQKNLNNLQKLRSKSYLHEPKIVNEKHHLVYSSFTVTESRQKEIESARNIYDYGNLVRDSIENSKQLKQPNEDNNFQELYEGQTQEQFHPYVSKDHELLCTEITKLFEEFSLLKKQEEELCEQNQQIVSQQLTILDENISYLEKLKQLSIKRSQDIESLRELVRIKKIHNFLKSKHKSYEAYLNSENSWQNYMTLEMNFDELNFHDLTSETHAQENILALN